MSKPKNKQIPITLYSALARAITAADRDARAGGVVSDETTVLVAEAKLELDAFRDRREFGEG